MEKYIQKIQLRWSDIDPNFHVRHSVYYDWAATARVEFLRGHGLTMKLLEEKKFGLILFREECSFRKEIVFGDEVSIDLELMAARRQYARWSIRHTIFKNDGIVAAILNVDGAWIDTVARKLMIPPSEADAVFSQMPVAKEFQWLN